MKGRTKRQPSIGALIEARLSRRAALSSVPAITKADGGEIVS